MIRYFSHFIEKKIYAQLCLKSFSMPHGRTVLSHEFKYLKTVKRDILWEKRDGGGIEGRLD